jgi:hypothetical protein
MKPWMACLTAAVLAMTPTAAPAQDAKLHSILADDGKDIAYTPCDPEEAAECIAHVISCRGSEEFGDGFAITLMGAQDNPDARKLASALLARDYGKALVVVSLGDGTRVDLPVQIITVSTNEMNADWDLWLFTYDQSNFFSALTDKTAADVRADIAGYRVVLSDDEASAANLLKFGKACS